jgi:hypothetical protein
MKRAIFVCTSLLCFYIRKYIYYACANSVRNCPVFTDFPQLYDVINKSIYLYIYLYIYLGYMYSFRLSIAEEKKNGRKSFSNTAFCYDQTVEVRSLPSKKLKISIPNKK